MAKDSKKTVVASLLSGKIGSLRRMQEAMDDRRREFLRADHEDTEEVSRGIEKARRLVMHDKATSGDALTDYFLVAHSSIDFARTIPLRAIEKQMVGKKGQLFLVIRRRIMANRAGALLWASHLLGILSDEKLELNASKQTFGIPTHLYANIDAGWMISIAAGPYTFGYREHQGFQSVICVGGRKAAPAFETLIGDRAVRKYLPKASARKDHLQRWAAVFDIAEKTLRSRRV